MELPFCCLHLKRIHTSNNNLYPLSNTMYCTGLTHKCVVTLWYILSWVLWQFIFCTATSHFFMSDWDGQHDVPVEKWLWNYKAEGPVNDEVKSFTVSSICVLGSGGPVVAVNVLTCTGQSALMGEIQRLRLPQVCHLHLFAPLSSLCHIKTSAVTTARFLGELWKLKCTIQFFWGGDLILYQAHTFSLYCL